MKNDIKQSIAIAFACFVCLSFSSGCMGSKQLAKTTPPKPPANRLPILSDIPEEQVQPVSKTPYQNGERYFYFLESQLMRKKGNLEKAVDYLEKNLALDPHSVYIQKELAVLFLRQRKTEKALDLVRDMLKEKPDDIPLMILYGKLLQGLKKDDEVERIYEQILKKDPSQKEIYQRLGSIYMEKGDHQNAYRIYEQLVKEFPDAYVGHFFLGKIHYARGNLEKAQQEFERTLALEPELEEPQFELIDIYQHQGKQKKVEKVYQELLDKEPENIRAALGLGYFYHLTGKKKEADKILFRLGRQTGQQPEIIRTVIQYYVEPKKYEETAVLVEGMIEGLPSNSDLHYIAGIAYDGLGNEKMMLKHLAEVTPASVFYPNAVVSIAFYYQEKGEAAKAIEYLKKVNQKVPDNADFILYLATSYEDAKQYELAEKTLLDGIRQLPDNPKLYFRLGVVYDKWGRKDDSIAMMKKVIDIDPQDANALNYLGYTYADQGKNLDIAEKYVREALKYKPDDGYIIDSLGWIYFQKGDYENAVKYLTRAAELAPDDPIILEHAGDAYFKLNDHENALKYYKKSLMKRDEGDQADIRNKIREAMKRGAAQK